MASLKIPEILPIFPLPETVLLPSEVLPLHIFEPRYRQMVRDVLDGSRVIGMTLLEPGTQSQGYEFSKMNPIGCAGVIAQHQALPDGRHLIILVGVQKFVIAEELPRATLYRQVRVEHCPEVSSPEERASLQGLRSELINKLPEILLRLRGERVAESELAKLDDNQLIAVATQILHLSTDEKQQVLESNNLVERYLLTHESIELQRLVMMGGDRERDPSELN